MSLDINGKFIVAVWMVPLERPKDLKGRVYRSGDWLATLYKEDGQSDYGCHMRFRYYVDAKVDNSEDVFSEFEGRFPNKTEAEALGTMNQMAEEIAKVGERGGGRPEIHKLIIRSSDMDTIFTHLAREDFFHIRLLPPEPRNP